MQGKFLVMAVLCAACSTSAAQVYRCANSLGAISYQDAPCANGREVTVRQSGASSPSGLRPAEKAWLKSLEKRQKPKSGTSRRAPQDKRRQEKRCWKKRQQLDEVRARLRRGYKPAQGEKLRRKRRSYEDYLFRYCD